MKLVFIFCLLTLAPLGALAATAASPAGRTGSWTQEVKTGDGRYSLSYNPDESRVDVTQLDPGASKPSEVKVKIQRQNAAPLDLKLKTLDTPPNELPQYTGEFEPWNGSVMGFELDMSFDHKTWKKVEHAFGAGSP